MNVLGLHFVENFYCFNRVSLVVGVGVGERDVEHRVFFI